MTLLLGVAFLAVLGLSFTILVLVTRPTQHEKAVQKQLGQMALAGQPHLGGINESQELLKPTEKEWFAWLDQVLQRSALASGLRLLILQANRTTTPSNLLLLTLGLAAAGFLLPYLLFRTLPLSAGLAGVAAAIPIISLRIRRARHLKAFNDVLTDAIELISRALRAGHSVASAIEVVAEEAQEPIATEFRLVFQQQNFGVPFRDSLLEMVRRVPSPDLRFVTTAMLVQKETGGNLTEILDRTAYVIRERLRIQGEVRVRTAQGRLTGLILSALPIILGLLISLINPTYAKPLFNDPIGVKLLYAGACMLIIGGLIIRKIITIEV